MAQVREYIGKPSAWRIAWEALCKAIAWAWIPLRVVKHYKAEGAKEERQTLIDLLSGTIKILEAKSGRGTPRHMRAVLSVIKRRHNQIENERRDGPGNDELIAEMSGEEYAALAKKEDGTVSVKFGGKK